MFAVMQRKGRGGERGGTKGRGVRHCLTPVMQRRR